MIDKYLDEITKDDDVQAVRVVGLDGTLKYAEVRRRSGKPVDPPKVDDDTVAEVQGGVVVLASKAAIREDEERKAKRATEAKPVDEEVKEVDLDAR